MRKTANIFILSLTLALFVSCATTNSSPVLIPDIPAPEFPIDVTDPAVSVTFDGNLVSIKNGNGNKNADIPLWLWLDFTEYSINVDSAIEQYKAVIKALSR